MIFLSTSSSSGWNGRWGMSSYQLVSSSMRGRAASRGILTRWSQMGQVQGGPSSSSLTLPLAILRHFAWYLEF
ncbi:hypothetical protein IMZ48_18660 [Candidatus Bathyarchaeota archaeon]|nr:hypothetical protein [Candidatus Bathyarchaeota archaeon]